MFPGSAERTVLASVFRSTYMSGDGSVIIFGKSGLSHGILLLVQQWKAWPCTGTRGTGPEAGGTATEEEAKLAVGDKVITCI